MKADLTAWAGSFSVTASLAGEPGEVIALVGPNGAGKSTLLRGLAGLASTEGSLVLAGRELIGVAPQRRGIGWVPQAGLLFPHLSALDNAAYALRSARTPRRQARARALELLTDLGIAELADRRPAGLSGGQAQRVALARALAAHPALLLLDEPLGALDAATREQVRRLLRTTLTASQAVSVVVTHDPVDAVVLADRIVVLEDGAVVQDATAAEVAVAPRSAWVARLLGLNAWRGTTSSSGLQVEGAHVVAAEPLPAGLDALALVDPSAVALHRRPPEGSPRTTLVGEVAESTALGGRVRVRLASNPAVLADVTPASAAELALAEGGSVWASIKATEIRLVRL